MDEGWTGSGFVRHAARFFKYTINHTLMISKAGKTRALASTQIVCASTRTRCWGGKGGRAAAAVVGWEEVVVVGRTPWDSAATASSVDPATMAVDGFVAGGRANGRFWGANGTARRPLRLLHLPVAERLFAGAVTERGSSSHRGIAHGK